MKQKILVALFLAAISSTSSMAAESAKPTDSSMSMPAPSKENREKMAVAHEKMAACLLSDKDFKECHDELRNECQSVMGGNCPGMGMRKGMGRGMRNRK